MGSTVEFNISVGVTILDCYKLRIVADVPKVVCL